MYISAIRATGLNLTKPQNFNGTFQFENYNKDWNPETREETQVDYYTYTPDRDETPQQINRAIYNFKEKYSSYEYDAQNDIRYKKHIAIAILPVIEKITHAKRKKGAQSKIHTKHLG